MDNQQFVATVWQYYHEHGRDLPWRQPEADGTHDAYKILVSEVMLQQTQVQRVIEKYHQFLAAFPTINDLAAASLASVLILWSGLGYNRRAKFLWLAAQRLVDLPQPWSYDSLVTCPGIGPNTAAAVLVYAYNRPWAFIETNIRTAYIHHFFADQPVVSDQAILQLVEQTYDQKQPREFFWALMDYGSHLKSQVGNVARQSQHYAKQSRFEGSRRQLRGAVLRQLALAPQTMNQLSERLADDRLTSVLEALISEGFITRHGESLHLRDQ